MPKRNVVELTDDQRDALVERNRDGVRIVWSFRVADARRKLAHLYPQTS
jgi:hypothetical protein